MPCWPMFAGGFFLAFLFDGLRRVCGLNRFCLWKLLLGGEIDGGHLRRWLGSHLDWLREADRLRCLHSWAAGFGPAVHQHQQSKEYQTDNKKIAQYWHSHLRLPSITFKIGAASINPRSLTLYCTCVRTLHRKGWPAYTNG